MELHRRSWVQVHPSRLGIGEFQYNGLGVDNSVLTQFKVPSGSAHVFSFTGNLRCEIKHDSKLSPYAIGGLGFYRRTVQFLQPTLAPAIFFDPFFGFVATGFIPADRVIGSVSRNGIGLNIGGGVSIKLGESGTRFFTEVRYHWADMHGRNTTLLPVTFGISW